MGRPSKYSAMMLSEAKSYLTECMDAVPTGAGLARYLGVAKSTIYKWADEYPEFSDALDDIQAEQECRLTNFGLRGEYNATIVKLMLSNHGYSEKIENTHAGPRGGPIELSNTELAIRAKQLMSDGP